MSQQTSIPLTHQQRSAIFSEYNRLRGRGNVERGRLNRALGLAQTGEERPYNTTVAGCDCPDRTHNGVRVCKHMAALRMQEVADRTVVAAGGSIDEINDALFG
jgi:predicted nucleic acid-binding Zn finger protein